MKKEHFFAGLFIAVVVLSFYLFYRILAPFLVPMCWSAIFVIVFYPMYQWLEKRVKSGNLRSLIMTTLIVILIIAPAAYLGIALVQETIGMFDHFKDWVDSGKLDQLIDIKNSPIYEYAQSRLSSYVDLSQLDLKIIIENSLKSVSKIALSQTTNILANTGRILFQFGMMIFFMFFLFRDGDKLFDQIKALIPMSGDQADTTVNHLKTVIEGTMYGGIVVSLIQGFLGGILWVIMGLPSPVFWGAFMAFLAFIPIVGPFLIYLPAGLILIATGSPIKGTLLIAIGTVAVSQIDNILRPLLVSGKTGMHTMLLFVSIMGGVSMFGLLGVVLGPVIAAVFVAMFDVFRLKLTEEETLAVETGPAVEGIEATDEESE
ncbi:MAG: AI-2E family transporter [FCB group bacterium]|nr:AI-2E family transporter [FCB group bacterium]